MNVGRAIGMALACVVLAGCPKKDDAGATDAAVGAATTGDASTTDASTSQSDAGSSAKGAAAFAGKYTVSAGTMYVPAEKDWASVRFKNDESKLLGDGEMTLAIDGAGRVTGTTDGGPLGASVIDGMSDGQTLAATIRRKDPTDGGLTGTLLAKIAGDKLDGTMQLAEFNAAVVRTATITATKK